MRFAVALLCFASPVYALQQTSAEGAGAVQFDLLVSAGAGGLWGGGGSRVAGPAGAVGAGIERRINASGSWRLESVLIGTFGELASPGSAERPEVKLIHAGLAVGYRHYTERGRFLGAGVGAAAVTRCDIEPELAVLDPNRGQVSCENFEDATVIPARAVALANATVGVIAGRVSIGLRVDAGLHPSVRSDDRALRLVNFGILGEYRFGSGRRRARSAVWPPEGANE